MTSLVWKDIAASRQDIARVEGHRGIAAGHRSRPGSHSAPCVAYQHVDVVHALCGERQSHLWRGEVYGRRGRVRSFAAVMALAYDTLLLSSTAKRRAAAGFQGCFRRRRPGGGAALAAQRTVRVTSRPSGTTATMTLIANTSACGELNELNELNDADREHQSLRGFQGATYLEGAVGLR
jgi:hypothetical protein